MPRHNSQFGRPTVLFLGKCEYIYERKYEGRCNVERPTIAIKKKSLADVKRLLGISDEERFAKLRQSEAATWARLEAEWPDLSDLDSSLPMEMFEEDWRRPQ